MNWKQRLILGICLLAACVGVSAKDVTIGKQVFHLEVADTPSAAVTGLMGRESLADDEGMIFVFSRQDVLHFWMKNTLIPLDVIFVNRNGVVTAVHTMKVEPPRMQGESLMHYEDRLPMYSSRFPCSFAIEIKAGMAEKLGIIPGSVISIPKN